MTTLDPIAAAERNRVLNAIATFGGGTIATVDAIAKSTHLERALVQRYAHRLVGEGLVTAKRVREGFSVMAYSLTADGRTEVIGAD